MRAVKTYAEVGSDKSLILKSLPFAPGSRVEVSEKNSMGSVYFGWKRADLGGGVFWLSGRGQASCNQ